MHVDDAQRDYLCAAANRSFRQQTSPRDIVWEFSGVRALLDDADAEASTVSRDYRLELDAEGAPLLNVLGGKLTTYRRLAEEAVDLLARLGGNAAPAWTASGALLPGAERGTPAQGAAWLATQWPWLPSSLAARWARTYGARAALILGQADSMDALGTHFGADLYEAEVRYLCAHEWVRQADDVLWRRTRLGLALHAAQQHRLARWLDTHAPTGRRALGSP